MKINFKNWSLKGYIKYLRKQNKHIQRVHAVLFAGIITAFIAFFILYTDYGFWHERYNRQDDVVATTTPDVPESPSEAISHFFSEARFRFSSIGSSTASLLEGKDIYTKEAQ